jgi:hypothetical protein
MAGSLTGTLDGLPVDISVTESDGVVLRLHSFASLRGLLRCSPQLREATRFLRGREIPLRLVVPGGWGVPISPQPHWLLALLGV